MAKLIKMSYKQWIKLRYKIERDFGNISTPLGLYYISMLYEKYVPIEARKHYKKCKSRRISYGGCE